MRRARILAVFTAVLVWLTPRLVLGSATTFAVDFSSNEISASSGCGVTTTDARYNASYGNSWMLHSPGKSSIQVSFVVPDNLLVQNARITVTHLTSYAEGARGNGYAPVTMSVNGSVLAENYDVAEHHNGSHGMETDEWTSTAVRQGRNSLIIAFGSDASTNYWIKDVRIEVSERPPGAVWGAAKNPSNTRLLPIALIAASAMDNYSFNEPFIWQPNAGTTRGVEYNADDNKLYFTLAGIQGKYSDRTDLTVLFNGLEVQKLDVRNGGGDFQTCAGTSVNVSESDVDVIYAPAYSAGNVDWNRGVQFAATLSGQPAGEFTMTIYAANPSEAARMYQDLGEFVFSPVLTVIKLHGYYDTYAVSSATYQCTFGSELRNAGRVSSLRTLWFILKSLVNTYPSLKR